MEKVILGDITDYVKGYAFSSENYVSEGIQIVRVSDFTKDSVSTDNAIFIQEKKEYEPYRLHEGDILVQTVGSWANNPNSVVGKVVRVPKQCEGAYLNQNIVKILPKSIDNDFLFYSLRANKFTSYCVIRGQGAANQASITLDTIFKFKFDMLDQENAKKASKFLRAIDDLIENNVARIKKLEKMAENLYKEWFVRFRFPGYETMEFEVKSPKGWIFGDKEVTSIPSNWHYGELKEIGEFIRGKNITADKMIEGEVPVISAGISPSGYHNVPNVFGGCITISASGANAGYLLYHLNDIWAADCSYYQNSENLWFVYNSLKFLQPVISNMQAGAAQPHVYPKHVNRICVIIPEKKWISKYCEIVSPIYDEIKVLKKKNDNLIKQRDLLLPRLMSGKLEV